MDNKDKYSASVTAQNVLSNQDEHLRERIEKAHKRKVEHWDNWQAVDINEVIQRFAPDAVPETKGVKVNWHSPTTGLTVVADVSGYLRIQDMNPGPYKKTYLDINGNHITDLPVRPGETPEQYKDRQMRISHFQILKREKMKK